MGYLCPKCEREVSYLHYREHMRNCKKTKKDYAEQDAERKLGA